VLAELAADRRIWLRISDVRKRLVGVLQQVETRRLVPHVRAELTALRSEPAAVRRAFGEEVKALKGAVAEIRRILPTQRARLERLLLAERSWTLREWRERYRDHGLLAPLSRRLIWWFDQGPEARAGAWLNGRIVDPRDCPLEGLNDQTRVRLWHPIGVPPEAVLERLLPRLTKLAGRWSLTDRFLVVRGDLRTYQIHLGSGNILMEPNSRYLCIVPSRSTAQSGELFLPFEGDQVLALILSKAFLLADDRAISDPTIRRQIGSS
jgi:hypothetical protein